MENYYLKIIPSCKSTNDEVKYSGKRGVKEGFSILALEQTKGRGSKNNLWISQRGNMFMSTLLRPDVSKKYWSQISLVIGVSIVQMLLDIGIKENEIKIKWPNDILINFKKISGILVESTDDFVIVGVGLNVLHHPGGQLSKYNSVSLSSVIPTKKFRLDQLTHLLLKKIYYNYNKWKTNHIQPFVKEINSFLAFINKPLCFIWNNEQKFGKLIGIDEDGLLKISNNNKEFKILSTDHYFISEGENYVSSD